MTFRSVDMSHYLMIIPSDHTYQTINQLGKLESTHFVDISSSNPANLAIKPFHKQLKRCDEILHNINMMNSALITAGIQNQYYDVAEDGFMEKQHELWKTEAKGLGIHYSKLLDYYQSEIQKQYERYQDTIHRLDKLKLREKYLLQKVACIETVQSFFGPASSTIKRESQRYFQDNAVDGEQHLSGISYIVGIIEQEAEVRFNRMIYRVSRGYACTRSLDDFKYKGLENFKEKVVMVIYPNSTSEVLSKKLKRVMQTFCTNVMDFDSFSNENSAGIQALKTEFQQTENCIKMQEKQLHHFLQYISEIDRIQRWKNFILKQKHLYESMNKLEQRNQFMVANLYIPKQKVSEVSVHLSHLSPTPSLQPISLGNPPTLFNTNSFTSVAQEITDTYGIPRYKQMNPTIFTCVTFPFLFGVMFGDIGHGLVLFVLGLYMVFYDEEIKKTSLRAISQLRYMVLMMGFFAFYCGWIYNDFIGFNLNIFGSCYDPKTPAIGLDNLKEGDQVPILPKKNCVYPFGLDPIWGRAENQLIFQNNLKMKLAVILGVLHMIIGICVKAANSQYFKKKIDFMFEFLPQIVFMVILFGYMDFLIIFKWLKTWNQEIGDVPPKQWAPSIITTMMNIGLAMGKTSNKPDGSSSMWGPKGHSWQDTLQIGILLVAFICVPLMLLPKPIIQIQRIKKKRNPLMKALNFESESDIRVSLMSSGKYQFGPQELSSNSQIFKSQIQGEQEHEEPSEIFVHQLIETIEFVLGTVSNTASYLRLWALSLAHSQLAKVFFQKTLQSSLQTKSLLMSIPGIIITFYMLCWITTGVLMCMDTMECFLHSLRLHWVEFQNKFYKGDGKRFQALSFKRYLIEKKGV